MPLEDVKDCEHGLPVGRCMACKDAGRLYSQVMAPGRADSIRVRVPPEIKQRAKEITHSRGSTISREVREFLYNLVQQAGNKS